MKENYGFFEIEKRNNYEAILLVPGYPEEKMCLDYQVVPLSNDTCLVSVAGRNIFLKSGVEGAFKVEYPFSFEAEYLDYMSSVYYKPAVEVETAYYKGDESLLAQGLIIIRVGSEYVLYDFVNNRILSRAYSNISIKDGKLIVEQCNYENITGYSKLDTQEEVRTESKAISDILTGELNLDGTLKGNMLESQKWNMAISLTDETFESMMNGYEQSCQMFSDLNTLPTFSYEDYIANRDRI